MRLCPPNTSIYILTLLCCLGQVFVEVPEMIYSVTEATNMFQGTPNPLLYLDTYVYIITECLTVKDIPTAYYVIARDNSMTTNIHKSPGLYSISIV